MTPCLFVKLFRDILFLALG